MQKNVMKEQENKPAAKDAFNLKHEFFDLCEIIIIALVVVTLTFTFIFRIVCVEGSSMEYTLMDNDRLIISHLFYQPEQGDIVVLELEDLFDTPIIKRVIATEGQTINITDNGEVSVDGEILDEPYIHAKTNPKDMEFPLTVPEDCVFVMGDNRGNSNDSRNFGCVNEENIMGQAIFRLFPLKSFGSI